MAVLMITHDLGVVANVAEEVVVMHNGRVMESSSLDHIFNRAEHPYLKALLSAVPRFHMAAGERLVPLREIDTGNSRILSRRNLSNADKADDRPLLTVCNLHASSTPHRGGFQHSP